MADSLLITGPPASGKSRAALDRFLSIPDSILLTPSATMAEHVRNTLARAGVLIRPTRVMTLAQFLDSRTALAPVPEPVLHLLIRQALEKLRLPRFTAVAEFRGFHRAVAALMEEAPLESLDGDLRLLCEEVERGLADRGMALRNKRLRNAGPGPVTHVVFDGFFSFSPGELDLIASIPSVTVTLPDSTRRRLGIAEQKLTEVYRRPRQTAFFATTLERETEEIARRILEYAAKGRAFREMGIILRVRDPYGPALETTLARFGIPARFYFSDALASHPAVDFLGGIVRLVLGGWDHAELLALIRRPLADARGSWRTMNRDREGAAWRSADQLDFELREKLPGAGLPLPAMSWLETLDPWRRDRLDPQEWAARLKSLRSFLPEPVIADRVSREQIAIWRSTAIALETFDEAMDAAASALTGRMTLAQFWQQAELTVALEPLRIPDRRRNVVHVMDVYEARQWELPVVFICGLTERHFPQYHREDPLLNDAARRRAGLATSADAQSEERFLFDMAVSRATDEVVLSRARFNEKGDENLPSFFLHGVQTEPCETRVRPKPQRERTAPSAKVIQEPELLEQLGKLHASLAPTSIESFLQCPFQFFAAKTLRLRSRPPAPRDRLDARTQGSILHRALAELDFDKVFDDAAARARIPTTYRREAVRLEMLRHFEAFLADRQVRLDWQTRVEEKFSFPLNPLVTIRGRIDRLETGPENQALVIDYKYSAGDQIRALKENALQCGLYLLAAERQFGLEPAGMLYCGLRKGVVWDGWHVAIPGLERVGESTTRAVLRELMAQAAATAMESYEAITSGRIAPQPADKNKCAWCDFRDVCRIETAAIAAAAGSE